ncbi:MAG TPA: SDR family oxidoreductase [Candidatus Dormibacteraeota bacterium]|jgi:NAD(P)-dependent dehydrogenase (short-subunit alcohol dehydrogenase family)|nr:SDR family oxidoreductase [Candidatus Dormibacteraeota bacterium]
MGDLDGRVALVTGAAGAGIGRATARTLAAAGATVVVTDVHERRTNETVEALRGEFGAERIVGHVLDGGDPEQIARVVAEVSASTGDIDVLVNNAAVNPFAEVDTLELADWDRAMAVDITGPWLLIRAVLPAMRRKGAGSIVNVSSVAAYTAPDREAPYAAAKAALHSLTRTVAREMGPYGVRCNAVAPGLIWTRFMEKFEDQFRPEVERTPLRRWGQPEDVADVVLFLASDASRFITGEALTVSGGWYMHA